MNLVKVLERRGHLPQHDVGAAAVHLADVVAFKGVREALGHAIGLRAGHRRVDGLDAQVLDQRVRILSPEGTAIIAQEFQFDAATDLRLTEACFDQATG